MFIKTRIKLSFLYVGIISLIIIIFSLILFHYTVQHIQDNVEEDTVGSNAQQIIANRNIDDLRNILIISDTIVIVLSGLFSYFLAEQTLKPIKIALKAQEQFSANASHELRTPLAIMKTENEVFLKNQHSTFDEAHRLAQSNLEEIDRMTGMVESLLILARSKKTNKDIDMEQFDISDLVNKVIDNLILSARTKKLELKLTSSPKIFITGNKKLIEQAIFNIIQNAITYTEKGKIVVFIEEKLDKVIIKTVDTGIGIPKKDIPRIFEPFFKVDPSRTYDSGNMGLGLSIVNEIIAIHDSEITVESELGEGTVITVIFNT